MSKIIRIRNAKQTDAVAVYRLIESMIEESEVPFPAIDPNRLMAWVVATIAQGETIVADLSGRVVGTLALVPIQHPWSQEWTLHCRWLFVMPSFRREGTGQKLIDAMVANVDAKGVGVSIAAAGADWQDAFLERQDGFVYTGGTFFRGA